MSLPAGPPSGGLYLKPPSRGGLCDGVTTMPSADRRRSAAGRGCGAGSRATPPASACSGRGCRRARSRRWRPSTSSAVDQAGCEERVGVAAEEERAGRCRRPRGARRSPGVVASDVRLVERPVQRRAAVAGGAERDLLLGDRRVGLLGVVGGDQGGHVDEVGAGCAGWPARGCWLMPASVSDFLVPGSGRWVRWRTGALGTGRAAGRARLPGDGCPSTSSWPPPAVGCVRLGRPRRPPGLRRPDAATCSASTPARFDHRVAPSGPPCTDDDAPAVEAAVHARCETCGDYAAEYRVGTATASVRWVEAHGRVLPGADGTGLAAARGRPRHDRAAARPRHGGPRARAHGRRVRRRRRGVAGDLPQPQRRAAGRRRPGGGRARCCGTSGRGSSRAGHDRACPRGGRHAASRRC